MRPSRICSGRYVGARKRSRSRIVTMRRRATRTKRRPRTRLRRRSCETGPRSHLHRPQRARPAGWWTAGNGRRAPRARCRRRRPTVSRSRPRRMVPIGGAIRPKRRLGRAGRRAALRRGTRRTRFSPIPQVSPQRPHPPPPLRPLQALSPPRPRIRAPSRLERVYQLIISPTVHSPHPLQLPTPTCAPRRGGAPTTRPFPPPLKALQPPQTLTLPPPHPNARSGPCSSDPHRLRRGMQLQRDR
jgi:hypothetical protein